MVAPSCSQATIVAAAFFCTTGHTDCPVESFPVPKSVNTEHTAPALRAESNIYIRASDIPGSRTREIGGVSNASGVPTNSMLDTASFCPKVSVHVADTDVPLSTLLHSILPEDVWSPMIRHIVPSTMQDKKSTSNQPRAVDNHDYLSF